ncbi:MAG: DUF1836 domain-containing protein [Clostridia bacterium]|nr:DUF1836 domain-containing protein [Clostridia bacterium]
MVDKETLRQKMLLWEELLSKYSLPAWEAFPMLPLYMDQVVFLLNQYLTMLPEQAEEKQVTPAMINNYVKLKIIPPPIKKRYGRVHLAYLVIVCVCKQTLNTSEIKKLIPLSLSEDEARVIYERFVSAFTEMQQYFRQEVRKAVKPIFSEKDEPVSHLLFRTAAAANLTKLLTEEILRLDGEKGVLSESTRS